MADDLEWQGLPVSPDLDTILYTLAGLADPVQGWGVAGDTQTGMGMLERYGAETWFRVGDADLATHVHRARADARGRQPDRCHRRAVARAGRAEPAAAGDR